MTAKVGTFKHGKFSVTIGPDGAIKVKEGDWISKYSACLHEGNVYKWDEYGRLEGGKMIPLADPNKIRAGETIYFLPTYEASRGGPTPVLTPKQKLQAEANKLVDAFESRSGGGKFPAISRAEVAQQLRVRIVDPGKIDQRSAGVCSTAVLLYSVADDRPSEYAQYVIDLFEKGEAQIKDWQVKPGTDLMNYKPPADKLNAADWIAMASIRDSENWFFDYEKYDGEGLFWGGGAASYEYAKWFKQAGFTQVLDETTSTSSALGVEHLKRAGLLRRQNYKIVLRIDATVLYDFQWKKGKTDNKGNHVVVLTSPIMLSRDAKGQEIVRFQVFTWGEGTRWVPASGSMPLATFLQYYYGFVAAKY